MASSSPVRGSFDADADGPVVPPLRPLAEDDLHTRQALELLLRQWGYAPIAVEDGEQAWEIMQGEAPPRLAILDWGMPNVDGLEVCRRVREMFPTAPPYLIVLTSKPGREQVIAGLEGRPDQCLTEPSDPGELRARIRAGFRLVSASDHLVERVRQLEATSDVVGPLQSGLRTTLRLCVAAFNETLTVREVPRHLRAALRMCEGLCRSALGDSGEAGDRRDD